MSILQQLKKYKESQREIFQYFGVGMVSSLPWIEDNTDMYWKLTEFNLLTTDTITEAKQNMWQRLRFIKVYEKDNYTGVLCSSLQENYFTILDNSKKYEL